MIASTSVLFVIAAMSANTIPIMSSSSLFDSEISSGFGEEVRAGAEVAEIDLSLIHI